MCVFMQKDDILGINFIEDSTFVHFNVLDW